MNLIWNHKYEINRDAPDKDWQNLSNPSKNYYILKHSDETHINNTSDSQVSVKYYKYYVR